MEQNSWQEWSRYVLKELERLALAQESLRDEVGKINRQIATLKTELQIKSGAWGALAGAIPIGIMLIIKVVQGS